MVSTSKILTVSYGTFSCTLEGFDDSFDTMKAIAEYFRDLAADDRYFGAEPPSPDAEMLARIAEREISRRVEARGTDGKIHLRADPAALPAEARQGEDRPASTAEDAAPRDTDEPIFETPGAATSARVAPEADQGDDDDMPFAQEDATAPVVAHHPGARPQGGSDSIADKLRRIRAVASPGASAFAGGNFDEDEQDFLPPSTEEAPKPSEYMAAADAAEPPQADETAAVTQPAPDGSADLGRAPRAEEVGSRPSDAPEAEEQSPSGDETTEADETSGGPADMAPVPARDATAPDAASDDDILARLATDETWETDTQGAEDGEIETPLAEDQEDALDALISANDDAQTTDAEAKTDTGPNDTDEDTLSQLLADAMTQDEPADAAPVQSAQETATASQEETADDPQGSAPEARPITARVVKMKRADLDAALAGGNLEEESQDNAGPSDLSAEAEADLQRELAEVEAELQQSRAPRAQIPHPSDAPAPDMPDAEEAFGDEDDEDQDGAYLDEDDEAEDARNVFAQDADHDGDDGNTPPSRGHHGAQHGPDAQASRIFDEADTQLEEPESNKRRSAIQHLRAAVAATRAERRAGGEMPQGVDDQPYRKDLQNAVRPRRPQAVGTATPRPGAPQTGRTAPLKLVAEQRIDTPATPVRPRRITRADLGAAPARPSGEATQGRMRETAPGTASFADYADRVGANSLTDLLEAAAAYLADVEGTPQFSRPMLMQKLREAHEDGFSREEGLRSFGLLLRQGKLQKLKGGRFAVTDVTEFRQSA